MLTSYRLEAMDELMLASDDEFEPYGANRDMITELIYEETVERWFDMNSLSSHT